MQSALVVSLLLPAKALFVTALVHATLTLARRGDTRMAALSATAVTVPALVLLAWQHDAAFVADAAWGLLLGTPPCALFASGWVWWLQRNMRSKTPAAATRGKPHTPNTWCAPTLAGVLTAGTTHYALALGPLLSGFIVSLPMMALCLAIGLYRARAPGEAIAAMQAYRGGLRWRVVMTLVVALGAVPLGAWAALTVAIATLLAAGVWQHRQHRRQRYLRTQMLQKNG